jgi:MFS family permease
MGLGVFVIANDFTALSVAIPKIDADLHTTLNHAQWVINGYALVFGVLIVTGGRLADLLGRKRIFMIGATIFGVFSLLCGLMPDIDLLIACRALMGVGAALMWPAVLGITYTLLPAAKKGLAGGLIIGVAGFGNTVGPLLGGWLTDVASWRLVFFVNLPVTAFGMLVTQRVVPGDQGTAASTISTTRASGWYPPGRWPCWSRSTWPRRTDSRGRDRARYQYRDRALGSFAEQRDHAGVPSGCGAGSAGVRAVGRFHPRPKRSPAHRAAAHPGHHRVGA